MPLRLQVLDAMDALKIAFEALERGDLRRARAMIDVAQAMVGEARSMVAAAEKGGA